MIAPFLPKQLLAPVSWKAFLDQTWENEHLLLPARGESYYDPLFRHQDVDALIPLAVGERGVRLARDGDKSEIPNDARALYRAYQEGSTVVINRVHRLWRSVNLFCLAIEEMLHHPVGVNLYLTPAHARGFGAHYDTHEVFILQISGRKIWDLYGVHCQLPLAGQKEELPEDLGEPEHSLVLEPGALLYMPRGLVHSARTAEDSSSLHLTLGIHVLRWSDLMADALNLASLVQVELRRSLPPGFLNRPAPKLVSHLAELFSGFSETANYQGAVASTTNRLLSRTGSPMDCHFQVLDKLATMGPATLLRKRTGVLFTLYEDGEQIILRFSGGTLSLPKRIRQALKYVLRAEWFSVASIPQLDAAGQLVLARKLIREGLLTLAD